MYLCVYIYTTPPLRVDHACRCPSEIKIAAWLALSWSCDGCLQRKVNATHTHTEIYIYSYVRLKVFLGDLADIDEQKIQKKCKVRGLYI